MPKKFAGENSKAVAARERKAAVKEAEHIKKQKELEDKYWEDDNKTLKKRQQKKEEIEKKKQLVSNKKAETKVLLEKELDSIAKVTKQPPVKITRAIIARESEKHKTAGSTTTTKVQNLVNDSILEENINRLQPQEVASTVDEAILILSNMSVNPDKHPEKRMKAAFASFEEKYLPEIKEENPTLRLSQLKQLLQKKWAKSSENPMNIKSE